MPYFFVSITFQIQLYLGSCVHVHSEEHCILKYSPTALSKDAFLYILSNKRNRFRIPLLTVAQHKLNLFALGSSQEISNLWKNTEPVVDSNDKAAIIDDSIWYRCTHNRVDGWCVISNSENWSYWLESPLSMGNDLLSCVNNSITSGKLFCIFCQSVSFGVMEEFLLSSHNSSLKIKLNVNDW